VALVNFIIQKGVDKRPDCKGSQVKKECREGRDTRVKNRLGVKSSDSSGEAGERTGGKERGD